MKSICVYCGWWRNTIIRTKPKNVGNVYFKIHCLECGGTGTWSYYPEEVTESLCVVCKGTGEQYLGL